MRAFWGLLYQMGRMIEVGGNLGDPCYGTTGVAEGDAMSVASTAALTLVAIHAIQAENPNITPACFADNWSIIASSVGDLCKSTEVLQKVVDKFRMNLSVPKSWVWGTTKLMRKELSTFELDGKPVPLKHTAKDLGVDMSYGKRLNKKTTKARWCKALGVLRKVRSRYLPVKFKILMTSSVGVGTMSYGSEFTGHSKWEWRSIRAGIARAINRLGSGANGLLAMAVTGDVVDPQLRIYVRMVKFWRRCLRIFPSMRTKFLANLCTGTCTNRTGPAGVFRVAFRMIGWECKDNGVLEHQSGLRLEWMQCSIRFLKKMLTLAWSNYGSTEMSKREAFDVQFFDAEMFRTSLQGRSHADQGLLTTYASGRHVTHDVLAKFSYKVHDSCCPLCKDHQDSKEHRIYQCLALREFRDSKVWRWPRNQPRAVSHFGICPLQIDAILEKQRVQSSVESFVLPVIEDQRAIVFTDGSAFHNDNFQLCVGGCAVVEWKGKPRLLVRALLATVDHSSFRAESYAIYLAMQRKRLVDIYCDCAAVVGLLQYLLECRGSNVTPNLSEHTDLWSPIWRHVQVRGPGEIRVFKTKAHVNWRQEGTLETKWQGHCNELVDKHAKDAVRQDHERLYKKFVRLADRYETVFEHMRCYHDFLVDAGRKAILAHDAEQGEQEANAYVPVVVSPPWQDHISCFDDSMINTCPFSKEFASRVDHWLRQLKWSVHDEQYVSCLELYIDFALFTRSYSPVRLRGKGVHSRTRIKYKVRDVDVALDHAEHSLASQHGVWVKFIRWVFKQGRTVFPGALVTGKKTLHSVGYSIPCVSLDVRPQLTCGHAAGLELWKYFHHSGGAVRSLQRVWRFK